jgi:hypothetical protein
VRYVFTLREGADTHADYTVEVRTSTYTTQLAVRIERHSVSVGDDAEGVAPEHLTQLTALARTLARRDDAPWPRRVERWRAPGVR